MPFEKNPDDLGALWMKSGAKGDYMTGTINGQAVVCFRNTSDNPKAPAWRVLKSKPKDGAERPTHNANVPPSDDPFGFGE